MEIEIRRVQNGWVLIDHNVEYEYVYKENEGQALIDHVNEILKNIVDRKR